MLHRFTSISHLGNKWEGDQTYLDGPIHISSTVCNKLVVTAAHAMLKTFLVCNADC